MRVTNVLLLTFFSVLNLNWVSNTSISKEYSSKDLKKRCAAELYADLSQPGWIDNLLKIKVIGETETVIYEPYISSGTPKTYIGYIPLGTDTFEITLFTEVQDSSLWGYVYLKNPYGTVVSCYPVHYGTNVITFTNIGVYCIGWTVSTGFTPC